MVRSVARLAATVAPRGLPLARDAWSSALARVFGPPPFDPRAHPGDTGLFGPGSASWQVIGEPAAIVGGLRGLLVQLLHPLAVAGVADHSRFRGDPMGRLQRTSAYVVTTTFGALPEALAVARAVRSVHRRVRGSAPDGRPYAADDPRLLTWVSVALTSSFLATDRAFAPQPVRSSAADAFVAEQSRAAALLDPRVDLDALARDAAALDDLRRGTLPLPLLDEGLLPSSVAGLRAVLDDFAGELAVGAQGRELLRFLLWPDVDPLVRAGYGPLLAGAVATLDLDQRRLLRLPVPRPAAAVVTAQVRGLLTVARLTTGGSPARGAATARSAPTAA